MVCWKRMVQTPCLPPKAQDQKASLTVKSAAALTVLTIY